MALNKDLAKASCYNKVASFVSNKCGDQSMAELNNQFAALQCQMGVLKEGVAEAQKQVTSAFQNNNQKIDWHILVPQRKNLVY